MHSTCRERAMQCILLVSMGCCRRMSFVRVTTLHCMCITCQWYLRCVSPYGSQGYCVWGGLGAKPKDNLRLLMKMHERPDQK